jgi:hypothetical protein
MTNTVFLVEGSRPHLQTVACCTDGRSSILKHHGGADTIGGRSGCHDSADEGDLPSWSLVEDADTVDAKSPDEEVRGEWRIGGIDGG